MHHYEKCVIEINKTQVDNAQDIYNLLEYSDNYLKTLGILYQNIRDETIPTVGCTNDNAIDSFEIKEKYLARQVKMAQKIFK